MEKLNEVINGPIEDLEKFIKIYQNGRRSADAAFRLR